jgi:hypothetical protein
MIEVFSFCGSPSNNSIAVDVCDISGNVCKYGESRRTLHSASKGLRSKAIRELETLLGKNQFEKTGKPRRGKTCTQGTLRCCVGENPAIVESGLDGT